MPAKTKLRQRPRPQKQGQQQIQQITTKNAVRITQAQSLELIKTFVHTSIGSLAYLRDLFPSEVYDEYEYIAENGVMDYETFTQGPEQAQVPSVTGNPRKKSGLLRVMKRGRCEKVDTFLNTLERGVFSALENGWLRAMDLIITSYASQPLKVLEKYTYDFCYGEETLVTIQMPNGSTEVSFDNVRRDIRSVIKRIIELDRVLPRLPANRFMAVQLHYTDSKPDDFQPPGFQLASPTIFQVEADRGWKPVETKFGGIFTEDHKASLSAHILEHQSGTAYLPDDIVYCEVPNNFLVRPISMSKEPEPLSSVKEIWRPEKIATNQNLGTVFSEMPMSPSIGALSEDEVTRGQLQQMQLSYQPKHSIVDTQTLTQLGVNIFDQLENRFRDRKPLMLAEKYLIPPRDFAHRRPAKDTDRVSCLCSDKEEGNHDVCQFCKRWQHTHCYGYIGRHDGAIPEEFSCIRCLLTPLPAKLVDVLRNTVLIRNAIEFVLTEGYSTDRKFKDALGCDEDTANTIVKQLATEGLLTPLKPRSKESISQRRHWRLVDKHDTMIQVVDKYFVPTLSLEFLFEKDEPQPRSDTIPLDLDENLSHVGAEDLDLRFQTPTRHHNARKRRTTSLEGPKGKRQRASTSVSQNLINVAVKSPHAHHTTYQ